MANLSIETFFTDELNDSVIAEIKSRGWDKAFVKKDRRALENIEEGKSVWLNTSFEEMNRFMMKCRLMPSMPFANS